MGDNIIPVKLEVKGRDEIEKLTKEMFTHIDRVNAIARQLGDVTLDFHLVIPNGTDVKVGTTVSTDEAEQ